MRKSIFLKLLCVFLILPVFLWSGASAANHSSPVLWGDLVAGKYQVGLTVKKFLEGDESDIDTSGPRRQVETLIWYPSSVSSRKEMSFGNYVSLLPEFRDRSNESEVRKWLSTAISGKADAIDKETSQRILRSKMYSRRNAKAAKKRFPLILWTMRHETEVAQSVLCEYLASHGYVVAVVRDPDNPMIGPWAIKSSEEKLKVFSKYLRDLDFAINKLTHERNVNSSKVALLNWSYAAELSSALQTRTPLIKLVIGLSSNPLSNFGLYQGADFISKLDKEKINVPYVIMSEKIGTNGKERTAPKILDELPTESYFVSFPKLAHGNFNVLEGMIPGVFGISKLQSWSKGGKTAKIGYEAVSRYTLFFLNSYLKTADKISEQRLGNKFPSEFVTVVRYGKK